MPPSSDPIIPFSSSPAIVLSPERRRDPTPPLRRSLFGSGSPHLLSEKPQRHHSLDLNDVPINLNSDSYDVPELGELLKDEQEKQSLAERQRNLAQLKKRTLALQATRPYYSDEDDDLEVVDDKRSGMQAAVKEEEQERRSGRKKVSEARKRHLSLGGVSMKKKGIVGGTDDGLPFVLGKSTKAKGKGSPEKGRVSQGELNKILARKVGEENRELTRRKEEEWVRRGGRVNVTEGVEGTEISVTDAWKAIAERGLKVAEEVRMQLDDEGEGDEGSDDDWRPELRGSASPSPGVVDENEEGTKQRHAEDTDITMVSASVGLATDDETENVKPRHPRRSLAIIDSESEGESDENVQPARKARQFAFDHDSTNPFEDSDENVMVGPISVPYRNSVSSLDDPTEDDGDKENNTKLMFDRSEDKENKAVTRHTVDSSRSLSGKGGTLFGLEDGLRRGLSMSPGIEARSGDPDEDDDKRKPLTDLVSDEDPFASQAEPSTFATKLQQAAPRSTPSLAALPLSSEPLPITPLLNDCDRGSGFSQFSDEESGPFGGVPLQPGFSDLFESATEKQKSINTPRQLGVLKIGGLSASFSDEVYPGDLDCLFAHD